MIVVIASFLCNGLIFGFINTYSVLHVEILTIFEKVGVENALTKACKFFNLIYCSYSGRENCTIFLLFSLDRLVDNRNHIFSLYDIWNCQRSHRNSIDYIYWGPYCQFKCVDCVFLYGSREFLYRHMYAVINQLILLEKYFSWNLFYRSIE